MTLAAHRASLRMARRGIQQVPKQITLGSSFVMSGCLEGLPLNSQMRALAGFEANDRERRISLLF